VLGAIAALAAVALLVLNIMAFLDAVDYYQAMGYPSGEVYKQLIPTQLLPGIFEPLAVYGGIAFLLFYIGGMNRKISACQASLSEPESGSNPEESVAEPEVVEEEENTAEATTQEEEDNNPEVTV
jgi:hypothetical protein